MDGGKGQIKMAREVIELLNLDIYVCGLEIEDKNGEQIINYLEKMSVKPFFAPGSRIMHIQPERMKRLMIYKEKY